MLRTVVVHLHSVVVKPAPLWHGDSGREDELVTATHEQTEFPVVLSGTENVFMWANEHNVEPVALNQLRNIAGLPWVHGVRVMPDVHLGIGATVGSVIAMRQAVAPAAVGVDIGCGMVGVKTSLTASDLPDDLGGLRSAVEQVIPVGFARHNAPVGTAPFRGMGPLSTKAGWVDFWRTMSALDDKVEVNDSTVHRQMGTLGGGNHFLEVTTDDDGVVWLMLHSGSRGIGNKIAQRHMAVAKTLPHNTDLPDKNLAVFLSGSPEMEVYLRDLYWAQEYAWRNRAVMMALFQNVVADFFDSADVTFDKSVQCHHNYVAEEHYDGEDVIVTRKGAIFAGVGAMGLIPGSMGTGSYVVRGIGNDASYQSASHGAGRRMSRSAAKRKFTVDDLREQTSGVECRKDAGVIDEIPAAYKDLDTVMNAQRDLVQVVARLTTVMCVKG